MQPGKRLSAVQVPSDLPRGAAESELVTNLKLVSSVRGGLIECRKLSVKTGHRGDDLLSSVCSRLRRDQLVAIPWEARTLLVLGPKPLQVRTVAAPAWQAEFSDAGRHILDIGNAAELAVAAKLVHALFIVMFENLPNYWRGSSSARIWYPYDSREISDGIAMHDRVSFSTQPISGLGVGVAIDVGHRFLSEHSVAHYFDSSVPAEEATRRRRAFAELSQRTERRKGTLAYNTGGNVKQTCYFVDYEEGMTCATTGPLHFGSKHFESLYHYYRKDRPELNVERDDVAVFVSFTGLSGPKPVSAKLLRLSISLEEDRVPYALRKRLPTPPYIRERLIDRVWKSLPLSRLADVGCVVSDGLWVPDAARERRLDAPSLVFADRTLRSPPASTIDDYISYYRSRRQILGEAGFLELEEVARRDIKLVMPPDTIRWSAELAQQFSTDLVAYIQRLAKREFTTKIVRASTCEVIVEKLGKDPCGIAVVVFDAKEHAAYALLSQELKRWRKKRLTVQKVSHVWEELHQAEPGLERNRAQQRWDDMMFHSAVDVLDQMGGTPWRLSSAPYEACLAIDVSDNRRHYGFTLVVCRDTERYPSFQRITRIWHKGDHQFETINSDLLADSLGKLMSELRSVLGGFDPLASLMVLRDGHECGDEMDGIREGLGRWREMGCLADHATVDVASLLKSSTKDLRIWRRRGEERSNVLEGHAVLLDEVTALVCCTGAATLGGRGTAEPIVLKAADDTMSLLRLAQGTFAFAQLNFSSPGRAHREPLPVRELDAALAERVAQDTRGIK
jgi:hypothetical protein